MDKYFKAKYGLTRREVNRMAREQGGTCKICNRKPRDQWGKLHIDHDHATGKIRGMLCHNCNTALGNFQDSPEILLRAVAYLRENS